MPTVAVVTDTTHYLPKGMLEGLGVLEVSLYVNFGGRQEREADMPDFEGFYDELRSSAELPTTSQPSIGDFLAVYEPLVAAGHEIVSIHLSGGISGTVESARQAAAEIAQRGGLVAVVDSGTTAGGMAAVVLAAAAATRGGGGIDAVVARAEAASEATKIWFAVDTLEYLRRGGRIGTAQAWLGGALKIKPILTLDGEVTPIERVRTSSRAFERLIDHLRARQADGATAWMVQHIQAPDEARRIVDRGREMFGTEPLFVSQIGPVIGTHAGPGLLGVGGIAPALLDERV